MKKDNLSYLLIAIMMAGCFASSGAAVNLQGLLFPNLELLKKQAQVQSKPYHATKARASRLSKRMSPGTGAISGTVSFANSFQS